MKEHLTAFGQYLKAEQQFTSKKADNYLHIIDSFLDFVNEEFGIDKITDISKAMVNSRYRAFLISHRDISDYLQSRMPMRMFFLYLHLN